MGLKRVQVLFGVVVERGYGLANGWCSWLDLLCGPHREECADDLYVNIRGRRGGRTRRRGKEEVESLRRRKLRVLQLSGERSREHEEKNDKWHRMERSSGKFVRRFRLPENAKMDEIKASMENGG
ncbi:hypothetical protein Leryth_025208 [Lithospermum erythrorhizon]|nr:hypothetical protein Leryth_025208 [Lithospermum erythrorhizon]